MASAHPCGHPDSSDQFGTDDAPAALAFSPDSQWLVIGVPTLAGGRILLYGPGDLEGPYAIGGTVPGPQIPLHIPGT